MMTVNLGSQANISVPDTVSVHVLYAYRVCTEGGFSKS